MGNPLFGVNISKLINDNVGSGVNDCTLTKVTSGTRTAGQLTGGTNPTPVDYPCRGFRDTIDANRIDGTMVQSTDVMVALMGDSIAGGTITPEPGDRVTVLGVEYNIIMVETDPALAVYSCTARAN